jgi:hypothetical protein
MRQGSSLRGHAEVAFGALYLLMVGKVRFGLVNGDDRLVLPLMRNIVNRRVSVPSNLSFVITDD